MKLVKEILYEKFTKDSDPIKDMNIGAKRIYYFFYVSTWAKDFLVDFDNIHHINLLKWLKDYNNIIALSPKEIRECRSLCKKAGIVERWMADNKLHVPLVSKYDGPDISMRESEVDDKEKWWGNPHRKYVNWANIKEISLNPEEHYKQIINGKAFKIYK